MIYLPFENSKKEAIFDRKIDLLIEKDNDMEATTIRELYIKRVHEKELKITQKLNKAIKLQQEEARMRQEEARMRQEEAQKHKEQLKTIVQSLYNQGNSVEKIAAITSESVESVQLIINNGKLS